jgi:hypothetical protein
MKAVASQKTKVVALAFIFAACGPALPRAAAPPESEGPYGDDRSTASQAIVGLEVATEGDAEPRLVAVVSHHDGTRETHDLGAYRGPIRELEPAGDMLVRVGNDEAEEIFLMRHEGSLRAMRRRPGVEDELLFELEMPAGTTLSPSHPVLVQPAAEPRLE